MSIYPLARFQRGVQVIDMICEATPVALTTTAGGVLNIVQNVNITNAINIAQYQNIFDEYRIVHARLRFIPNQIDAIVAANLYADCMVVVDYDNNTVFTTYSSAANYDSVKHFCLNRGFTIEFQPLGQPDLAWSNTSVGFDAGWFKFFGSGLSVSTQYGRFYVEYFVQYRQVF
jgi:hypothetical protein